MERMKRKGGPAKTLTKTRIRIRVPGPSDRSFRALERGMFLNGALSTYDLTGKSTDRLIEALQPLYEIKQGPFQAVDSAFGATGAHLSDATSWAGREIVGKVVIKDGDLTIAHEKVDLAILDAHVGDARHRK